MGDVEVEVAVAVHIGERHRRATEGGREAGPIGCLAELSSTVVLEKADAVVEGGHKQVQIPVLIKVGKDRTGGVLTRAVDPGVRECPFESPVAEIAKEGVGGFKPAEIQITKAVTVDVAGRHARAVQEIPIENGTVPGDVVGEGNALGGSVQALEAGLIASVNLGSEPAKPVTRFPFGGEGSGRGGEKDRQGGGEAPWDVVVAGVSPPGIHLELKRVGSTDFRSARRGARL